MKDCCEEVNLSFFRINKGDINESLATEFLITTVTLHDDGESLAN